MGQKLESIDGSSPLRDRQETFCQLYSQGTYSASEAYRLAGYAKKGADAHSARLAVKGSIKDRLSYLQAERAEKEQITRETLASDYRSAYAVAARADNAAGMVSATAGKARLYGLDKQVIEQSTPEPMSRTEQQQADEWAEFRLWQAGRGTGRVVGIRGPARQQLARENDPKPNQSQGKTG